MNFNLTLENYLKEMANYIVDAVSQKLAVSGVNNAIPPPKLFTNKQACEFLNVCPKTLQNYRDRGQIVFRQTGRKICYTQEDLYAFLSKNKKEEFNKNKHYCPIKKFKNTVTI
jgi:hypothetical protein